MSTARTSGPAGCSRRRAPRAHHRWRSALTALALPGAPTPTHDAWQRFDRGAPTLLRFGFAFAVLWFTWTPWLRHRAPLHRLPRATADAILRRAGRRSGPLHRQLVLALKLVVALTTEASR